VGGKNFVKNSSIRIMIQISVKTGRFVVSETSLLSKKDYKNSSTSSSVISEMISTIVPVPQWKNFLSKIPELTK